MRNTVCERVRERAREGEKEGVCERVRERGRGTGFKVAHPSMNP